MDAEKLLKKMKGQDCTNKWDVVCFYTLSMINDLLEKKYAEGGFTKTVSLTFEIWDDREEEDIPVNIELTLKEPKLKFEGESAHLVHLHMEIASGYYEKIFSTGRKRHVFPENSYVFDIAVPLSAMVGHRGTDNALTTVQGSNETIVILDPGSIVDASIVLDFKNTSSNTYTIKKKGANGSLQKLDTHDADPEVTARICEQICLLFHDQVDILEYCIGTINNEPSSRDTVLLPSSFKFFIVQGETLDSGKTCLAIYISTDKGTSGSSAPSFQPGGEVCYPIPDGYSATLLISRNTLVNKYLIPQIKTCGDGWSADDAEPANGPRLPEGICINVYTPVSANIPGIDQREYNHHYVSDSVSLDFSSGNPMKLSLCTTNSSLTWSCVKDSSCCHSWSSTFGPNEDNRDIRSTFSCNKSSSIVLGTKDSTEWNGKVHIPFKFSESDFTVSITERNKPLIPFPSSILKMTTKDIQTKISHFVPTLTMNLGDLNAFAVTNVLLPGRHVLQFKSKEEGDRIAYVPRDFVLFCSVVASL